MFLGGGSFGGVFCVVWVGVGLYEDVDWGGIYLPRIIISYAC